VAESATTLLEATFPNLPTQLSDRQRLISEQVKRKLSLPFLHSEPPIQAYEIAQAINEAAGINAPQEPMKYQSKFSENAVKQLSQPWLIYSTPASVQEYSPRDGNWPR
jgi:hypothetical protein